MAPLECADLSALFAYRCSPQIADKAPTSRRTPNCVSIFAHFWLTRCNHDSSRRTGRDCLCEKDISRLATNQPQASRLISPYGGSLVDLTVPGQQFQVTGAFSPLNGFMGHVDYERVVGEMRLGSGQVFPIPVTLPVERRRDISLDRDVALRDSRNELLAVLNVTEIYEWNRNELARLVFGTEDPRHPLVAETSRWGQLNISGTLQVLARPRRYDFRELRLTPLETRSRLLQMGHQNVVAFQTRNPLHRAHEEITKRAAEQVDGALLLHPVVGLTKPGDVDHYTRVRSYKALA